MTLDCAADFMRLWAPKNREAEAASEAWRRAHQTPDGELQYSAGDLSTLPERPVYAVTDRRGWLAIDTGSYVYGMDLARITSPLELLALVEHLCGKAWTDRERVRQVIREVRKVKGWDQT